MSGKPKVLVIVGPTASGKSDLAVKLAQKLNGEVISADSRQVYKGLDIGTGKITREEMEGVPHHLLDVADAQDKFTVVHYVDLANRAITEILSRGKLPIICGGTGFYIQALVDGTIFPEVSVNERLRNDLKDTAPEELLSRLKKIDPARARELASNPSDSKNARRIIRAIEVATAGQKTTAVTVESKFDPIFIGLNIPIDQLRIKIRNRLIKRLDAGMIQEAEKLHVEGLSYERMEELGLEYRYMARHLQREISKDEMIEKLNIEIGKYAKRQMTWFRKDKRIEWFVSSQFEPVLEYVQKSI